MAIPDPDDYRRSDGPVPDNAPAVLYAPPFKGRGRPGESNAPGRPRKLSAADARKAARSLAAQALNRLTWAIECGDVAPAVLVHIYREASDRAGFLTGRDLAAAEAARWQVAAQLMAVPGLSDADRREIIDRTRGREQEALAEYGPEALPVDVGTDE